MRRIDIFWIFIYLDTTYLLCLYSLRDCMKHSITYCLLISLISSASGGIHCADGASQRSPSSQEEPSSLRVVGRDEINLRIPPQTNILYHFTRSPHGIGLSIVKIRDNLTRSEYEKYHKDPEGFKRDTLRKFAPQYYQAQETIEESKAALQNSEKQKPSLYNLLAYRSWSSQHKKLEDLHKQIAFKYNREQHRFEFFFKQANTRYNALVKLLEDSTILTFEEFAKQNPRESNLWKTQLPKGIQHLLVQVNTNDTIENLASLRIFNIIAQKPKNDSKSDSGFVIIADPDVTNSELDELLGKTEEQTIQDPPIQKILCKAGLEAMKAALNN